MKDKLKKTETGDIVQWYSTCLACVRTFSLYIERKFNPQHHKKGKKGKRAKGRKLEMRVQTGNMEDGVVPKETLFFFLSFVHL
jgi:hypothetical protein